VSGAVQTGPKEAECNCAETVRTCPVGSCGLVGSPCKCPRHGFSILLDGLVSNESMMDGHVLPSCCHAGSGENNIRQNKVHGDGGEVRAL
jgi:hypothetical protein